MKAKRIVVVTYNGIDGACAAATVLLKHPQAEMFVSSANRIGRTLSEIAGAAGAPSEVHVCGVGIRCEWGEVVPAAEKLKRKGSEIIWYCGRGYLDADKEKFLKVCTPVFQKMESNTEVVFKHLAIDNTPVAEFLLCLAKRDPRIGKEKGEMSVEEAFWRDFIDASVAQYFKYQDTDAYVKAIRKLACLKYNPSDVAMVEVFRRTGYRYVLEGNSKQMRDLRQKIKTVAEVDEPVVITGESGVGKEFVAHLIHERSSRATGPFVAVNCALFCGNVGLANSVLFGHTKGAFTGAERERKGAFLTADGGILFLDEVGEMPLEVQAKLLRVLEDGLVTPEGADEPAGQVDVRILAATNRGLTGMVHRGEFRADLYHRLDTLRLQVPPLREHPDDIVAIAKMTLEMLPPQDRPRQFSNRDIILLQTYEWPGNVRQLVKLLKRCAYMRMSIAEALKEERRVAARLEDDGKTAGIMPRSPGDIRPLDEVECKYAARALELNGGNITKTAEALGISKNTLKKIIRGRANK